MLYRIAKESFCTIYNQGELKPLKSRGPEGRVPGKRFATTPSRLSEKRENSFLGVFCAKKMSALQSKMDRYRFAFFLIPYDSLCEALSTAVGGQVELAAQKNWHKKDIYSVGKFNVSFCA